MKFIHTADWQIGMKAAHVGAAGKAVREARLYTILTIVTLAQENHANFILVAGDTFENNSIDRLQVQKVADILSKTQIPVFILPGNHDPLVPGSVWEHPAWKTCDNVHILIEREPIEIPGGIILYPCPVLQKYSRKDPTTWIEKSREDRIRIGIAHGTVEGVHQDEPDYPIPRHAAERCGLDYLALGHWHSTTTYEDSSGCIRMAYSGTHETTKFGERDSGNILLVDIPGRGIPPVVKNIHVGTLTWKLVEGNLRAPGELASLRKDIENMENPEKTLMDVRIKGLLFCEDRGEIEQIRDILDSRFLFGRFDLSDAIPSATDDKWVADLPPGVVRETANILRDLSKPNFSGKRPDWVTSEIASRALLELYALVSEVAR